MEDREIVNLYWERNSNAIKETASKYGGYCKAIAKNILGNNEDAEECVNDTYVGVWNAIPPTRPSNFMSFVCKIARNLSLKRYCFNINHYFQSEVYYFPECFKSLIGIFANNAGTAPLLPSDSVWVI